MIHKSTDLGKINHCIGSFRIQGHSWIGGFLLPIGQKSGVPSSLPGIHILCSGSTVGLFLMSQHTFFLPYSSLLLSHYPFMNVVIFHVTYV